MKIRTTTVLIVTLMAVWLSGCGAEQPTRRRPHLRQCARRA